MRMRREAGRYVYVYKIDRGFEDDTTEITVYGTYKRACEALHKRMMEILTNMAYSEKEIADAKRLFVDQCRYSLINESGVYEDGFIDIHKVF